MWHQLDLILDRKTQESEREFYGLVGLVAIRFAKLEALYSDLLSDLIHPNDNLLAATLSKEFFHYKTIELVKDIGRMRPLDLEELEDIVSKAKSLRHIRNDFVHGIWEIDDSGDEITAVCSQRDISYEQKGSEKLWKQGYKTRKVNLEKLRDIAINVENLTKRVQNLIDDIEENPQDYTS